MATPINSTNQSTVTYNTYTTGATPVDDEEETGIGAEAIDSNSDREITNDSQAMGKDEFLQLLIAEMKYQDPLDPVSNTDSIAQLANFSSLEQMQNLNNSFETLSASLEGSMLSGGAQLIGKVTTGYTEVYNDDGTKEDQRFSGEVLGVSIKNGTAYYTVLDEETNSLVEVVESEIISVQNKTETSSSDSSTSDNTSTDSTSDTSDTTDTSTSEVEKDVEAEDDSETEDEPA